MILAITTACRQLFMLADHIGDGKNKCREGELAKTVTCRKSSGTSGPKPALEIAYRSAKAMLSVTVTSNCIYHAAFQAICH